MDKLLSPWPVVFYGQPLMSVRRRLARLKFFNLENLFQRPSRSYSIFFRWEPSIKDVCTKSRKIGPPPCPCGHTNNVKNLMFFSAKMCGRSHLKNPLPLARTGQTPLPLTADIFYGRFPTDNVTKCFAIISYV